MYSFNRFYGDNLKKIIRHFDVLINRVQEGLRVVDEISRFHLENRDFELKLKEFRHILREPVSLKDADLLNCRDSINDFGFSVTTGMENSRKDIYSIARASFKRVIESVRVMEELSKLDFIEPKLNLELIRQKLYQLEKKMLLNLIKPKLNNSIYPIIEIDSNPQKISIVEREVGYAQLRVKNCSDRKVSEYIVKLKKKYPELKIIINDRVDFALIHNLSGVHLGQDDISPLEARSILGDDKLIGLSTHNIDQVEEANTLPIDYIGFGPMFETKTKDTGYSERGTKLLKEVFKISKHPIVAIGGIDISNYKNVLENGAYSVAMISGISKISNNKLLELLSSSKLNS
ncbi:MAG: hypothetical protein CR982_00875 [Candidatus Cloacimonadota bacterium]|nr:MAG: hypothetical protein CR982_00875 [Candidatus Cloacimonadota bacterium]PIE78409.1 MAG: hypothetical protein CSA15_08025 [Candidatus Delongbacteria bacterium]